ncbi:MAG: transcriptional regulator [Pleomorphochaeta sp.]
MNDYNLNNQTEENFERAKNRAKIQVLLSKLKWENSDLLSLYEVTELIKPRSQSYIGLKSIPIKDIIGSEGRARDFSKAFYPKRELLKERWKSIDKAHLQYIDLPAISVYKLGQWYFVRDGNHRVSVAKSQGSEFIDADIVELDSQIPLKQGMTMRDLRKKVVDFERQEFLNQYHFEDILPINEIVFSASGMYPEVLNHINVHKYYLNEDSEKEIPYEKAVKSWYNTVYAPIIKEVRKLNLLSSFPGNTEGDLYIWIVRHWEELKNISNSQKVSIESATLDYKVRYSKGFWERLIKRILNFFFKK